MPDPVDTTALRRDLTDFMDDIAGPDDARYEWLVDHIEKPVQRLICERNGHIVADDMCLKPEHRYCVVCDEPMPNVPVTDDRAAMNIDPDPPGFTPDPSFRFIPPTCPTCGTPHTLARKFNGGDPIAFYQPDCDCDDDPAVFPVYMSGTIVGPVERIVAADHALDDEVGTYEVDAEKPGDHGGDDAL